MVTSLTNSENTTMRSYPRNSPEAAARIVALVMISDGHVSKSELEALHRFDGLRELGLQPENMLGIVQRLCEDLLMEGFDGRPILSHLDDRAITSLMAEVDAPHLQSKVLRIAESVIHADKHLSDGEAAMLERISKHWQIYPVTAVGKAATAMRQYF